jgi:hypothetical protein
MGRTRPETEWVDSTSLGRDLPEEQEVATRRLNIAEILTRDTWLAKTLRLQLLSFVNLRVFVVSNFRVSVVRRKITRMVISGCQSSIQRSRSFGIGVVQETMNDEDIQAREQEVREKIARQLRSIGHALRKSLTGEELQELRTAAGRLDQMLKASADADREALRSAVGKLDNLLRDLRDGKDLNLRLKRLTKLDDSHTKQE